MVWDFNVLHLMLGINNLIGSNERNKVIVHPIQKHQGSYKILNTF